MLQYFNKILRLTLTALILLLNKAQAGTFVQFEEPALIGFESNGKIYGYYGSSNSRTGFSCVFFFQTLESEKDLFSPKKIISFYTESSFQNRNESADVSGQLYKNEDSWIISLEDQAAGCNAAVGWNFKLGPQEKGVKEFKIIKNIPAIELLFATKKTHFYKNTNGKFTPLKSFITTNDVFVVQKNAGIYSYGRYVDVDMSRINNNPTVTFGWIQRADLENPFKSN
jgi:hypothetical protein